MLAYFEKKGDTKSCYERTMGGHRRGDENQETSTSANTCISWIAMIGSNVHCFIEGREARRSGANFVTGREGECVTIH